MFILDPDKTVWCRGVNMLKFLYWLDKVIAKIEGLVIAIGCGAIFIILVAQTILRYGFSAPLFWAEDVSTQLLVLITFMGLSLLTYERRLIRLDFILNVLSLKTRAIVTMISDFLITVILLILLVYSIRWVNSPLTQLELSATISFPRWYNYMVIPIFLATMTLHHLATVARVTFSQQIKDY